MAVALTSLCLNYRSIVRIEHTGLTERSVFLLFRIGDEKLKRASKRPSSFGSLGPMAPSEGSDGPNRLQISPEANGAPKSDDRSIVLSIVPL